VRTRCVTAAFVRPGPRRAHTGDSARLRHAAA
jgi:hypothetical protein